MKWILHFWNKPNLVLSLSYTGLPWWLSWLKNVPAMQKTWVWSLGLEDPLAEGNSYPFQYSGLENSMDCISTDIQRVGYDWTTFTSHVRANCIFQRWPQQYNPIPHAFTTWPWHPSHWVVDSMILSLESGWDLCNFFNQDSTMGLAVCEFQDQIIKMLSTSNLLS